MTAVQRCWMHSHQITAGFCIELYLANQQQISDFFLVGGFNPSEKYPRQNGNLPQIGVKIKNI